MGSTGPAEILVKDSPLAPPAPLSPTEAQQAGVPDSADPDVHAPIDLVSDTSESDDNLTDPKGDSNAALAVEPVDQVSANIPPVSDILATRDPISAAGPSCVHGHCQPGRAGACPGSPLVCVPVWLPTHRLLHLGHGRIAKCTLSGSPSLLLSFLCGAGSLPFVGWLVSS